MPKTYNLEERLDFALGQIAALTSFSQALLLTHPRSQEMMDAFDKIVRAPEDSALYANVQDSYIEGLHDIRKKLHIVFAIPQNKAKPNLVRKS